MAPNLGTENDDEVKALWGTPRYVSLCVHLEQAPVAVQLLLHIVLMVVVGAAALLISGKVRLF